ncbi:MAG: hypothetical protein QXW79_01360 [Thermoplasmata archaeon]
MMTTSFSSFLIDKFSDSPLQKSKMCIVTMNASDEEEFMLMNPFPDSSVKKSESKATWRQISEGEELSIKGLLSSEKEMELEKKLEEKSSKKIPNEPESRKSMSCIIDLNRRMKITPSELLTEPSEKKSKTMEKIRTTWRQLSDADELSVRGLTTTENPYTKSISSLGGQKSRKETSVKEKIENINKYLEKLEKADEIKIEEGIENLEIDKDKKVSTKCMIEIFSGNIKTQECKNINAYTKDNQLDLEEISKLEKNFDDKLKFYTNLYGFIISLVRDIVGSGYNATIFTNLSKMIDRTLVLMGNFISENKVFNKKILTTVYNLLYLHSVLLNRRVLAGDTLTKLDELYNNLTKEIDENIKLYNNLKSNVEGKFAKSSNVSELQIPQVDELINKLKVRLENIKELKKSLTEKSKAVKKNIEDLKNMVEQKIQTLGNQLASAKK